jgi:ureidoacrylate peracid hydrolase
MTDTALIIVDMQNAFCSKKGSFWKRGRKILNLEKILRTNQKLLSFARNKKWLVIFTKLVFKKDYSGSELLVKRNPEIVKIGAYKEGSWDSEIIESLKPRENEYVAIKKRHDPFIGTNLLQILQKK